MILQPPLQAPSATRLAFVHLGTHVTHLFECEIEAGIQREGREAEISSVQPDRVTCPDCRRSWVWRQYQRSRIK